MKINQLNHRSQIIHKETLHDRRLQMYLLSKDNTILNTSNTETSTEYRKTYKSLVMKQKIRNTQTHKMLKGNTPNMK